MERCNVKPKDMTEAITANMEKRDASFNDLVEVKNLTNQTLKLFSRKQA